MMYCNFALYNRWPLY